MGLSPAGRGRASAQPDVVNARRDWEVRRHRAHPRAVGVSHAAASGLAVVGVLAATVTVAGALGMHPIATPASASSAWLAPGLGSTPLSGSPSAATSPTAPGVKPLSGRPTELRIPTIKVDTTLETLGLDKNGALIPPTFAHAGWYAAGTAPGDIGPAVIAGHIDSKSAPSVFYHLDELSVGDRIEVKRGGRWIDFTVVATGRYPKTSFPTVEVYGPTRTPQLRLITCGGAFDSHARSYVDNVVVYAVVDS